MAMAMIIAIVAPTIYAIKSDVVARFEALVAIGAWVGAAGSTTNDVSEVDGQYPLLPWKVAITL